MTSEYPCVDFSSERHRQDRIELDPPLRALSQWSLSGVRGAPRIAGGAVFVTFQENDHVRVACHDEHSAEIVWTHPMGLGSSTPHDRDWRLPGP